jgi:D-3-phosphoglycerate dehydrogenase
VTANIKKLVYFEKWVDPIAVKILSGRPDIDLVRLKFAAPEEENWVEMRLAHGYQIRSRGELRPPWFGDDELLKDCPNLVAICSTGAGYDMVDVNACTKRGVIVCNQSGTNKEPVAEHALGMMILLSKKMGLSDKAMRVQQNLDRYAYTGNDIMGKTVGIIGIGHIGTRVAELCRGLFQMIVLAYDPYLTAEQIAARGALKVEFDEVLRRSDFLSVHCPRTDETFGMLGREQFSKMKPTAFFITTARGGIHKEDDLAEALKEGRLAGAGLDVWLQEPPALDHPLLFLDNVFATPHNAGMTFEACYQMSKSAAEQWLDIFAGRVPPRLVNPQAWPLFSERFEQLLGFRPTPLA